MAMMISVLTVSDGFAARGGTILVDYLQNLGGINVKLQPLGARNLRPRPRAAKH